MENANISRKKLYISVAVIVALIMIVIISVVCYNNYQEPKRDDICFKKVSDGYYVTEYIGEESLVVIPAEVNGIPVTGIGGEAFFECENLRAVEIPESVTYIGVDAFRRCTNLKSIEFPSKLVKIGDYAFCGCSKLSEIVFLDSWGAFGKERALKEIGQKAFAECQSLETITIPAQLEILGKYAFSDCIKLTTVDFEGKSQLKRIEGGAFADCPLRNISIPLSVEYIGEYAFHGCDQLETIDIIPVEGWVIFHDDPWVVSGAPVAVPLEVLQDSSKTAYYLAGEFSKYAWERRL